METIWFILWGLLWGIYLMLDGFDLGLGMLLPIVGKTDLDRRMVYNAMGPFWDGNEVWLLTAGGVTFAAFPGTYAVMFSALYTPLMMLLFALILRGISFEMRSKEEGKRWRATWDACLVLGSFLPALLLGVFFGNLFAGVPIDAEGIFQGNLFTLLHPYGLLGGVTFVLLFVHHGALWLWLKTEGDLSERGRRIATAVWPVMLGAVVALVGASVLATKLFDNYVAMPPLFAILAVAVAGLVLTRVYLGRVQPWRAWIASAVGILFVTLFGVAGLYPALMPSSLDPAFSRTAFNTASSSLTLITMLVVALVMVPVVIGYQLWVYVKFRGKVTVEDLEY
jgi:cytochrome d ubiquinol oxidase subunit II